MKTKQNKTNPRRILGYLMAFAMVLFTNGNAWAQTTAGCTNSSACNYDGLATVDDGSCNVPNSALSEVCCYLSAGTWINLNVGGNGGLPTISSSGDLFDWSMSSSAWVSTSAPDANGFVTVVYASDVNNSSVLTSSC